MARENIALRNARRFKRRDERKFQDAQYARLVGRLFPPRESLWERILRHYDKWVITFTGEHCRALRE